MKKASSSSKKGSGVGERKHAGIETIDLVVNDKVQNNLDETAGELIENIQRDDLTPVEIAEALNLFIEEGWKQKDIADRLGKNITFVSTHLSLLKLPDCVRELYDNEVCSDTETLNNLRLLFDLNEERCRAVCAVAMSDGITRKQSRELLNDAKRIKDEMEKGPLTGSHQNDELGAGNTDEQSLNSGGDGTSEQTGNDDLNLAQEELEGVKIPMVRTMMTKTLCVMKRVSTKILSSSQITAARTKMKKAVMLFLLCRRTRNGRTSGLTV